MPDHHSSTDETSHLFGNQNPPVPAKTWRIPLELLKVFGLSMPLVGLAVGYFFTFTYVFCDTCSKDLDKTYIVKLFLFMHTCVLIDFNPGKTPVAILFIIGVTVLVFFTVLDKERIKRDYAAHPCLKYVVIFSQYTWRIRVFAFLAFPMCFVNSPAYDPHPFVDPEHATWVELFADPAWHAFILHYIPYLLWQLAVALMAIEQAWYHYAMGTMPFGFSKTVINIYLCVVVLFLIYYTVWIITFLIGVWIPGHTIRDEDGVIHYAFVGKFIMYGYDVISVGVPIILSVARSYGVKCKKSEDWVLTFSPSKKE